jgi:hypothetical protein
MSRTDTHRPSVLDPADYTMVGEFDDHHEEGFFHLDAEYSEKNWFDRIGSGRCDHCGNHLRYGVIFYHAPSDELVKVGLTCAHTLALTSLSEKSFRENLEYRRIRKIEEAWRAANTDNEKVAVALADYHEMQMQGVERWDEFYSSLHSKLRRYGSLSENQVNALLRSIERKAEWAAKKAAEVAAMADAPALAEGRYDIEGEVVSTKWQDSDYGETLKMLVKMDDGNKVWGTVPSALDIEKGDRVAFSATVKKSNDDEHFGYFSRPTKATKKEEVAV